MSVDIVERTSNTCVIVVRDDLKWSDRVSQDSLKRSCCCSISSRLNMLHRILNIACCFGRIQ